MFQRCQQVHLCDMLNSTESQNVFRLGLLEKTILSLVTTLPCCLFFFINGILLFTLRSKAVFRETSRYILLFNLLFTDTLQMVLCQTLYLMFVLRIISFPICGFLVVLTNLANEISPLTLVVMSLERYVAVCFPLRHAALITIRNTGVAIFMVWALCSFNALTRVLLLIETSFTDYNHLPMREVCTTFVMFLGSLSDIYDKAYACCLFASSAAAVTSFYIGVMVAARSASTDKTLAQKARNTLLLHLVQLGLSLSSTLHNTMLVGISKALERMVLVRIQVFLYVFLIILPRCLSALIYGLKDQTIRPVFMSYLCSRLTLF